MMTITVELGEHSYPIHIGDGLLDRSELLEPHLGGRDVLVVSNTTVAPLYLGRVLAALSGVARQVKSLVLPDGESWKTPATLSTVLDALVEGHFARDCVVLALGGGVVGDITGFAAAIYQRGVDFIQLPTTLLAQVDSSVGGKTGVNHPGGKNLLGAFHQPVCVVTDPSVLDTLPDRELSAGLAEVLKAALILDAEFFDWMEQDPAALLARDTRRLMHAIRRSCEIKAAVVAADEREHGQRALLNLGHTFGHAIELCLGYGEWLHGEAVGAGIGMAARFSRQLGWLGASDVARVEQLLAALALPVAPPRLDAVAFLEAMSMDKKVKGGKLRLILLRDIGKGCVTSDFDHDALVRFVHDELRDAARD